MSYCAGLRIGWFMSRNNRSAIARGLTDHSFTMKSMLFAQTPSICTIRGIAVTFESTHYLHPRMFLETYLHEARTGSSGCLGFVWQLPHILLVWCSIVPSLLHVCWSDETWLPSSLQTLHYFIFAAQYFRSFLASHFTTHRLHSITQNIVADQ